MNIHNITTILVLSCYCAVSAEESLLSPYAEKTIREAEEYLLEARNEYESEVHRVIKRGVDALEKEVRNATKEGDLKSAIATTLWVEKMKNGVFLANFEEKYFSETLLCDGESRPVSLVELKEIAIDGQNRVGFDAGCIDKGQRIILQYVSGTWKGWGGIASENPDAEAQERGDRCRLAIVVDDEVVAVVPPRTSSKPYTYEIKHSGNLTFRINDDDNDWASNPQGHVVYKLGIR